MRKSHIYNKADRSAVLVRFLLQALSIFIRFRPIRFAPNKNKIIKLAASQVNYKVFAINSTNFWDEAFIDLVQNGYNEGFKGYMVGANYTFAKNIVGAVKYFDLEAKEHKGDQDTLYVELNFMF